MGVGACALPAQAAKALAKALQHLRVQVTAMLWLALTYLLVTIWPCLACALIDQAALAQLQVDAGHQVWYCCCL